jgi:phosphoribosylformylglycinamidine cyclo-ligase
VPPIFSWLARLGALSDDDLFRTFNMGVGFVVVVPAEAADGVVGRANELGERAGRIGVVRPGAGRVQRRGRWRDNRP